MRKRTAPTITATLAAMTLLAACGTGDSTVPAEAPEAPAELATAEESPSAEQEPEQASIDSVARLRDFYMAAGGSCPGFSPSDKVKLAVESAECGPDTVLMVFDSTADRDENVGSLTDAGSDVLVGDTWAVSAPLPTLEAVADAMSGRVEEAPTPELGTRENPGVPVEDVVTFTEGSESMWEVSVGYANFDAWDVVAAANQFNDPPAEDNVYVMLPVTATYIAPTGSSSPRREVNVAFVSADGRSFEETYEVMPEPFRDIADLYTGGTGTGNMLFEVPADATEGGTWAVSYRWSDDPMFIAALPE